MEQWAKLSPYVEVKIINADDNVGEVLARGENVMQGYFNNANATESAPTMMAGFTLAMGSIRPQVAIVPRWKSKGSQVTSSGENIYLDDVEHVIGVIRLIKEYTW